MNAGWKAVGAGLAVLVLCAGCGPSGPLYQPVAAIPPGHGVVYIYADILEGSVGITHNNQQLATLRASEYLVDFPGPGPNVYGFESTFAQRGGLFGAMGIIDSSPPQPAVLTIEPGKTYYLKMIGASGHPGFWRMDDGAGVAELPNHHLVATR